MQINLARSVEQKSIVLIRPQKLYHQKQTREATKNQLSPQPKYPIKKQTRNSKTTITKKQAKAQTKSKQ